MSLHPSKNEATSPDCGQYYISHPDLLWEWWFSCQNSSFQLWEVLSFCNRCIFELSARFVFERCIYFGVMCIFWERLVGQSPTDTKRVAGYQYYLRFCSTGTWSPSMNKSVWKPHGSGVRYKVLLQSTWPAMRFLCFGMQGRFELLEKVEGHCSL